MGGWFGGSRKKHRILVLGPRSVGKTTVMYRLSRQPVPDTMVPTAADVIEKYVESPDGHRFLFAEQKAESPKASAVIYVISKGDITQQMAALENLVEHGLNPQAPLIVLVNKQDDSSNDNDELEVAASAVTPRIGTNRSWAVLGCSSMENSGLDNVITWLENKLPL